MGTRSRMAIALVRIAAVYMLIGLGIGMFVGVTGRYAFISVHSHVSLLGWTTMALAALVYVAFPACERSRLAPVHFWLHNVGLPVMVGGLVVKAAGQTSGEPVVALGSMLILAAMAAFTANVLVNAGAALRLPGAYPAGSPDGNAPGPAPCADVGRRLPA